MLFHCDKSLVGASKSSTSVPREALLIDSPDDDVEDSSEEEEEDIEESTPKPRPFPASRPKKNQPKNIDLAKCEEGYDSDGNLPFVYDY